MENLSQAELLYKIDLYYHNKLESQIAKSFQIEIDNNSELKSLVKERFLELSLMDEIIASNIRNQFDSLKPKKELKPKKLVLLALLILMLMGILYYLFIKPANHINEKPEILLPDEKINIPAPIKMDSLSTPIDTSVKEIKKEPIAKLDEILSPTKSDLAYHSIEIDNWVDANYDPPLLSSLRGKVNEDTIANLIKSNWNNKNYKEVCKLTEMINSSNSKYAYYQWIAANAFYLDEIYDRSISKFQNVVALKEMPISENAEWYIILASIKAGKSRYTISNLLSKIVANENHLFLQEARELQKVLQ